MRGSFATQILNNGIEIRDVADILGHRNIETTENYYISSVNCKWNIVQLIIDFLIDITNCIKLLIDKN